ncbi:MAG: AMP-binding protein, partial [Chloroflexi bacterium]|nr:AMP-binding protein [Chloroflexota bacterium]
MNQSNRDASQAPENDRGTNIGQDAELPIRKAPINGPVPVSFVQERLWLFEQLRPGNYNSCFAVRIVGNLNVKALHDSFTEMLRRHESLRTNYRLLDGQLAQIINPPMAFPQSIIDYSKIAEAKREIQVSAFIHEDYRRPFDLSRDLLFRSSLLQLAPEIHVLIITRHHLLCDEWSMGIFFQELSALYENFSLGKSSNLPEPEIQFADFAWWQRNSFLETERASHLSYWKEQLCDRLPELHLPGEESKVPAQIFRGARYSILLPKRLSDRLKRLSRREAVSLSDLMLAAFQTLLYRYTGELNIAVGSPVPNRSRSKLQGLIGCVSNTLILCADLSGNPTFRELMGRVKRVAQQAKDHQDIPFEIVVRELGSRQAGQYELPIRIMFSHQEPEFYIPKLAGLTVSPMDSLGMIANLDLTLQSMVTEQGLTISLGYNGAQLNDDAVSRMLGHLKVLLMGIVKDPDDRISTLPILSAKERRQILYGWNDTKKNYPNDRCLHQHFESQVERTPNEPAVIFEDKQLTFLELNQRANQLGHYLVGLGVEPGQVVALCMRRSIEMATGILGILKAGGACLLLDPALPPDRKSFMLNDADVTAMLIQRSVLDRLPAHSAHLVNLDTSGKSIAKESEENLNTGVSANHAACVVYTSGSTGAPKGLVLSHTSACSSFLPETALHRLTAADRYLATTYSFMMPDIFWPWLAGARAVMATDEGYGDSGYLVRLIAEQQITFSCIVPSMLQALLE